MRCNDEFINYLKPLGYSVVRLPRPGIKPLQLLASSGKDLARLGELESVLVVKPGLDSVAPPIKHSPKSATVTGQRSSQLSAGVGLSILGAVLQAMGGSKAAFEAKYERARTLQFEFPEVQEDTVDLVALDQHLSACDINPLSTHVATMLEADDVYVLTAVLKSRKISVLGTDATGGALEVAVPELQQLVGGEVTVSASKEVSTAVTYEGKSALVFGFQAIRLFYKDGRYSAFDFASPGKAMMRSDADDPAQPRASSRKQFFTSEGAFVRLG